MTGTATEPFNVATDADQGFVMHGPVPNPVTDVVAEARAQKYNYGLGEHSPGVDQLKYDMKSGEEAQQRLLQLSSKAVRDQNLKIDMLRSYVAEAGPAADPAFAQAIMNAEADDLKNPETFYEKQYAKRFMSDMAVLDYEPTEVDGIVLDDSAISEAMAEDPEAAQGVLDAGERIKINFESDLKIKEDLDAEIASMGWGAWGAALGETLIPYKSWYSMQNVVANAPTVSFLLGNNLEEQYEYLNTLPPDERRTAILAAVAELKASNVLEAQQFMAGLVSYSGTEKFFNNAVSVTDLSTPFPVVGITTVAGLKAAGRGATKGVTKLANVTKAALKASASPVTAPAAVVSATGNVAKAGLMQTLARLSVRANETVGRGGANSFMDMATELPSLTNPAALTHDLGHFSREYADRLTDVLMNNSDAAFRETFLNTLQTGRLDEATNLVAVQEVKDTLNVAYGRGSDIVIDVAPIGPEDAFVNSNYVKATIGNKDATLFESAEQALEVNRNFYGLQNAKVKTIGGKFALEVHVPVNETAATVRDALKLATDKATPRSMATMFLPFLRSSKDRWDKFIGAEADAAMMGGARLSVLAKQILKPIGQLSKKEYDKLDEFMNFQRDFKDAAGNRGTFSKTLGEFERDWLTVHKALPSTKEADAYFAAIQMNDFGWVITNSGLFRDKSRKGLQMFGFGKRAPAEIEGKLVKPETLWESTENAGIVIMDDIDPGDFKAIYKNWLGGKNAPSKADIDKMLASGEYKLVQVSDIGKKKFREVYKDSDKKIGSVDFVITKNTTSRPLDFKQLPYKPGGHVEVDDGFFVSQPNISRHGGASTGHAQVTTYSGDKNLYHFLTEKEGQTVIKNLEHARQLLKDRKVNELKLFLQGKAGLPHTTKEFIAMFKGKNAQYDVNEPFRLRKKNESLEQRYALSQMKENPNFISSKDSYYNLYRGGVNLEWAGERGDHIYTIINSGSTLAPTYNYQPARHVNALTTLQRAASGAMRGRVIDDFKHQAAERFIAEFGDVLEGNIIDIRANPYKALMDGNFKKLPDTDMKIAAAKASRRATMEFLGTRSDLGKHIDVIKAKLWQNLLEKKGEDGAYAAVSFKDKLDSWSLGLTKDPVSFMRSLAFHQKLGLFNPAQLLLQMNTVFHTMGVAGPVNGMKGFEAAMHHMRALMNPDHFDLLAVKTTTWNPAELRESWEWANRTGWYRVGREVAVRSDFFDEDLFTAGLKGKANRTLEAGTFFFREGERMTRMTAWNAAYLEFKKANPGKAIRDADAKQILHRADLMSANMTAASNSAWQRGIVGLPTQFWGYQARIMEQMLGKRLTPAEKARVFATYSVVYGIPVAAGSVVGFWPVHESVKQMALENGYEAEGPLKFLDEGLLSVLVESFAGEQFNVSERFGPGGLPILEDVLSGDTTILEALGGVSGATLQDKGVIGENLKALSPILYSFANLLTLNTMDPAYAMTTDDVIDLARTVNSANALHNVYTAYALGSYISKNGLETDDVQGWESIYNLFGLTPTRISEAYNILENENSRKEWQKEGMKSAVKEIRRSFNEDLTPEEQMQHSKRASDLMNTYNLTLAQRRQVLLDGVNRMENTVRSITKRAAQNPGPYRDYFEKQTNRRMQREQN
jgi:hypothetical protein